MNSSANKFFILFWNDAFYLQFRVLKNNTQIFLYNKYVIYCYLKKKSKIKNKKNSKSFSNFLSSINKKKIVCFTTSNLRIEL